MASAKAQSEISKPESASDIAKKLSQMAAKGATSSADARARATEPQVDLHAESGVPNSQLQSGDTSGFMLPYLNSELTNIETKVMHAQEKGQFSLEQRLGAFEGEIKDTLHSFKWSTIRWILIPIIAILIAAISQSQVAYRGIDRRVVRLETKIEQTQDQQVLPVTRGELENSASDAADSETVEPQIETDEASEP